MHLARQKSHSDAEFYQMQRQAEANKILLTREYLEIKKYESLSQNNKIYYGSDIPQMFIHGGCSKEDVNHVENLGGNKLESNLKNKQN